MEGTSSYGAGLARLLRSAGVEVVAYCVDDLQADTARLLKALKAT